MALPGRDKTFALENCRDLLRKLEREIERFTAARDDVEGRIDHAFNIVVTAWHLCATGCFGDLKNLQIFRPNAIGRGHHASLAFQLTAL
jgi:hypothetical protein